MSVDQKLTTLRRCRPGPTGIRNRGLAQSYAEQSKARIIPLDHRAMMQDRALLPLWSLQQHVGLASRAIDTSKDPIALEIRG